jgi:hypothetical protein
MTGEFEIVAERGLVRPVARRLPDETGAPGTVEKMVLLRVVVAPSAPV